MVKLSSPDGFTAFPLVRCQVCFKARIRISKTTPPKTNMEPENGALEKEIPIGNHHFQVPC